MQFTRIQLVEMARICQCRDHDAGRSAFAGDHPAGAIPPDGVFSCCAAVHHS